MMFPEVWLDEEGRVVGGTVVEERTVVDEFGEEKSRTIEEGRFVVNLDHPDLLVFSSRRMPGTISIAFTRIGMDGLQFQGLALVHESEENLMKELWPRSSLGMSLHLPGCSFCSAAGRWCECSDVMKVRLLRPCPNEFGSWQDFRRLFFSFEPETVLSRMTILEESGTTVAAWKSVDRWLYGKGPPIVGRLLQAYLSRSRDPRHPSPLQATQPREVRNVSHVEPTEILPSQQDDEESGADAPTSSSHHELPSCPQCNKSFSSRSNVRRHQQMVHLNVRRFFCVYCGMGFYTARDFARHNRRRHPS